MFITCVTHVSGSKEAFYIGNIFGLSTLVLSTRKTAVCRARKGWFLCLLVRNRRQTDGSFLNLLLFAFINVYIMEIYKRLPMNLAMITAPFPPFVVQSACRME
jgi:hypothetical protein